MGSDDAFMFDKEQEARKTGERRVIAVDLDGTLAHYDGWRGVRHIGEPIPEVVARVKEARRRGIRVWIFTARVDRLTHTDVDVALAIGVIEAWCRTHIGEALPVTSIKRRDFSEIWDDRAVQIVRNTGCAVGSAFHPSVWKELNAGAWSEVDPTTSYRDVGPVQLRVELSNTGKWLCWYGDDRLSISFPTVHEARDHLEEFARRTAMRMLALLGDP